MDGIMPIFRVLIKNKPSKTHLYSFVFHRYMIEEYGRFFGFFWKLSYPLKAQMCKTLKNKKYL